ncbi:MAG TPA: TIGR02453 family protein [Acidisphaera sp.]|nr:TIGR02453 family protein [Acidisphaera sp.]
MFAGFPPDAFAFLRELAAEQNKPWFEANRQRYESGVRAPLGALVEALATRFAERDVPLQGDAKRSLFRLHRDVRFAKDRSPYKTHAGAVLFRQGGSKQPNGVLYVHIQPRESFAAAAFYMPEPALLNALRAAIRDNPQTWRDVVRRLHAAGLTLSDGEPLTRMPRGYEHLADSDVAPAIRMRSFMVRTKLTQALLGKSEAVAAIADFTEAAMPLLRWGWAAMDAPSEPESRIARFLPNPRSRA